MCGRLSVERDGPHVKFSMEFASDDFCDAFSVERYHGMRQKHDSHGNVVRDTNGEPVMEEDWRHVHTGTRKFVRDTAHDWKHHHPDDSNPIPHGQCRFRALAYQVEVLPSGVTHQVTNGEYSNIVVG